MITGGRKVPEKMLLRLFLSTLNCDNAMLEDRDSQLIHEPTKVVNTKYSIHCAQKYSRLRCLLRVKGLVICFYLGWSGSILQFRQNIIKVGSKSWLLTCSSNITLSLPSYTGSALKRELNFCNGYLSLLYFWSRLLSTFRSQL